MELDYFESMFTNNRERGIINTHNISEIPNDDIELYDDNRTEGLDKFNKIQISNFTKSMIAPSKTTFS